MTEIYPIRHAQTEGSRFPVHQDLRDDEQLQVTLFSPAEDRAYYERCYADAWMFSHGDLRGFSAATYYTAACRHHPAWWIWTLCVRRKTRPDGSACSIWNRSFAEKAMGFSSWNGPTGFTACREDRACGSLWPKATGLPAPSMSARASDGSAKRMGRQESCCVWNARSLPPESPADRGKTGSACRCAGPFFIL